MGKKRFRKVRYVERASNSKNEVIKNQVAESLQNSNDNRNKQNNAFLEFYNKNYKQLLIIPFLILILALGQIAYQTVTTGEFIKRGVTLKGGTELEVLLNSNNNIVLDDLKVALQSEYPSNDFELRELKSGIDKSSIVIETDISDSKEIIDVKKVIISNTGVVDNQISSRMVSASLGESFFTQIMIALVVAFLFMGLVVYLYFRTLVPSLAIVLAAFSDIVITVAIINVLGMKVSSYGIAAFLMLIGYSIDTDILLSTRLLKRKEGTEFERIIQSAKTGLTMSASTLAAVIIVLFFSKSEILSQIMIIILIGLLIDIINTWIQNVGILRFYLNRKPKAMKYRSE